jgi:16S rRNA (uracil1498-N3)-methyltransferase
VPVIHPPVLLADWLKQTQAELKLVLHPVAEPLVSHAKPATLAFLIGPEGGLSDAEVDQAKAAVFTPPASAHVCCAPRPRRLWPWRSAQQLWGDF